MRRISGIAALPVLAALVLAAPMPGRALAGTSLWKAEKDGATVYLGGTIHLLRKADYPLPEEFDKAYGMADLLVFETDVSLMEDPALQTRLLTRAMLPEGESLRTVLSAETYASLREHCESIGLPIGALEGYRPGIVAVTLISIEFQKLGITEEGIDVHYSRRAAEDGKPTLFLETVDEQIGYIVEMGEGYEDEFIRHGLEEMEETGETMERLIAFWREGRSDSLASLMLEEVERDYPRLYESLFLSRNDKWLPVIEGYFDTPETELVLVGTAHLIGDEGIIEALRSRGYKVSRM